MTVQSAQLVLPISIDPDATWAHWVSRVETEHLESAVQQVAGERDQGVFVWGGAGEGKSHLLQASCAGQSESVRYIPMDAVLDYPPAAVLEAAEHESLVVIDDIHLLSEHRIWQEGVFHCFNRCMQNSTPLLVSAPTAPSGLTSFLPDLQSRLSLLSVFKLPAWRDADFETLLVRLARARGLSFTPEVARFLALRIRRTPADAERIIRSIDQFSLVEQRAPTIPFLKTLGY